MLRQRHRDGARSDIYAAACRLRRLRRKRIPRHSLLEGVEESLAVLRSAVSNPSGKPVADRLEERQGVSGTALVAPQPGKARGGAQLPQLGFLLSGDTEGLAI